MSECCALKPTDMFGLLSCRCWGDGFVTNSAVVQASNMANPSTLLTTIASKVSSS
jgi:hypothetical protein